MNPLATWFKSVVGIVTLSLSLIAATAYTWKIYHWGGTSARKTLADYKLAQIEAVRLGVLAAEERAEENRVAATKAREEAATAELAFAKILKAKQNELRKTTANLVVCKLNADTVRLLNDAGRAATTSQN